MSNQDRTLDQYQELMQLNAATHLIRAARELGVIGELIEGQKTIEQLATALDLNPQRLTRLVESLVAIGVVEQYEDDFALAPALQLLCQYDADLGDARWNKLKDYVRGHQDSIVSRQSHFDAVAATQWIHTPAAMQAAEILNIGGEGELAGPGILDLGCGSGVWSCAMAHRDQGATVLAVGSAGAIAAARTTADSIGLQNRFETIEADPVEFDPASLDPSDRQFDLVLIAQRLSGLCDEAASTVLSQAIAVAKPGGRVVVIDPFRSTDQMKLADCIESIRLESVEEGGKIRTLEEGKSMLSRAGFESIQFTFLAASRISFGLLIGTKPLMMA